MTDEVHEFRVVILVYFDVSSQQVVFETAIWQKNSEIVLFVLFFFIFILPPITEKRRWRCTLDESAPA